MEAKKMSEEKKGCKRVESRTKASNNGRKKSGKGQHYRQ